MCGTCGSYAQLKTAWSLSDGIQTSWVASWTIRLRSIAHSIAWRTRTSCQGAPFSAKLKSMCPKRFCGERVTVTPGIFEYDGYSDGSARNHASVSPVFNCV